MGPVRRPTVTGLVAGLVFLAAGAAWVRLVAPPAPQVVVAWVVAVAVVGAWLPGVANQITLTRAYLAAPALVYALLPGTLLPLAGVVTLAGVTDVVDGWIARRLERPSSLGGGLDPVVDGVFFGALAIGLAAGQAYPVWRSELLIVRYGLPALVEAGRSQRGRGPARARRRLGQAP